VDGFLVGGASLIAADFIPIIQSSKHKYWLDSNL
jgi:triosephosphate isomerase